MESKAQHLTAAEIERLYARQASAEEYRRAVRHLLTRCRRCVLTMGAYAVAEELSSEADAAVYDPVFEGLERRLKTLLGRRSDG
jgi:hypothetical protein